MSKGVAPYGLHSVDWTPYLGHDWAMAYDSTVPMDHLKALGERISQYPATHVLQRQVEKIYEDRRLMAAGEKLVDWGFAETSGLRHPGGQRDPAFALHREDSAAVPSSIATPCCTVRPMPAPTPAVQPA